MLKYSLFRPNRSTALRLVMVVILVVSIAWTVITTSSSTSSLLLPWELPSFHFFIVLLDHWWIDRMIPYGIVPCYTLLMVWYISMRYYYDTFIRMDKSANNNKTSLCLASHSSQSQSFQKVQTVPCSCTEQVQSTTSSRQHQQQQSPIDFSGVYQLLQSHNLEPLLRAQGVPWWLVRTAHQVKPIHTFQHTFHNHNNHHNNHHPMPYQSICINVQIQMQSLLLTQPPIIMESYETYYVIDDELPIETVVGGRLFLEQVTYLKRKDSWYDQQQQLQQIQKQKVASSLSSQNVTPAAKQEEEKKESDNDEKDDDDNERIVGIQTYKRAMNKDKKYTLLIQRRWSDDKSQIFLTSQLKIMLDEEDPTQQNNNHNIIESQQIFQRI